MDNKVGTRVLYYYNSGEIVHVLHRISGAVNDRPDSKILYVDIPYDDFDPLTHYIEGLSRTSKPIIKPIGVTETEEQIRIRELEDLLLMKMDSDLGGGIL